MGPDIKRLAPGFLALIVAVLPLSALAADEDDRPFIYATYFNCDVTGEERADEIVETVWKGIYDKAVKKGTINSWGWLTHQTGGKWRRLSYYTAPTIPALLEAQEKIGDEIDKKLDGSTEFGAICSAHDDYIWRSVVSSAGTDLSTSRGKVGMSVYFVCDITKESRADEIVKSVMAPIYNAHTGKGKLSSWGWTEHIVGGKYRRLATFTADNWETLFEMRGSMFEAMDESELADEFGEICGSHSDYMWNIKHENP